MYEELDDGLIGGQNLLTGTHDGSIYKDGEAFQKDGTISGVSYKFSKPFELTNIITSHGYYTISFLVYVPKASGDLFNSNTVKVSFFNKITGEGDAVTIEEVSHTSAYTNKNEEFKFVKFTVDTEITELFCPISISISTVNNVPFVIGDLKLERGKIATAWSKSIDDAIVELPPGLLQKPKLGQITVPTTGWQDFTGDEYYTKYVDIPLEGCTTLDVFMGTVAMTDVDKASNCALAFKASTDKSGYVTLYANTIPTEEIHIDYVLMKAKYGIESIGQLTIPIEGWIDNDDTYYKKKVVIPFQGVSPTDVFIGNLTFDTNDIGAECELYDIQSGDGFVVVTAKSVPTAPIKYDYTIIEGESV